MQIFKSLEILPGKSSINAVGLEMKYNYIRENSRFRLLLLIN